MKQKIQENTCSLYGIYCLGLIGAAIYFISLATSFWTGVLGLLKAIIWPVFFVLDAFKHFAI